MALPKVSVVTPTVEDTPSIDAFASRLTGYYGLKKGLDINYQVYAAGDDYGDLDNEAKRAVEDFAATDTGVLVACGSAAAEYLKNRTQTIPIVLAAGGEPPSGPRPRNLTGFTIEGLATAKRHLKKLLVKLGVKDVTIVYDRENPVSKKIFDTLVPDPISTPSIKQLRIRAASQFDTENPRTEGVMVIPNAMYYKHYKDVAKMLGRNMDVIKWVYYPERQFKNEHQQGHRVKVKVDGHDIQAAFSAAADYVFHILQNTMDVPGTGFQPAPPDNDDPPDPPFKRKAKSSKGKTKSSKAKTKSSKGKTKPAKGKTKSRARSRKK
jgi:hypothetical protein